MSEDVAQAATDGAGIWRDPSGIVQLAEQADNHVSLDHGVTLICDSHRTLTARLTVRRDRSRKRIPCPECGRMTTVYLRKGAPNDRRQ